MITNLTTLKPFSKRSSSDSLATHVFACCPEGAHITLHAQHTIKSQSKYYHCQAHKLTECQAPKLTFSYTQLFSKLLQASQPSVIPAVEF